MGLLRFIEYQAISAVFAVGILGSAGALFLVGYAIGETVLWLT